MVFFVQAAWVAEMRSGAAKLLGAGVIMSTKCSLVPPTWRASMYAASFAEGSISAYSRSMTRTVSPTLMSAFELSDVTLAKSPARL